MKKILLFTFGLLSVFVSRSQVIQFGNQYPIWSESGMNNFQQTSDGGYILCTDAIPEMDTAYSLGRGYLVKMNSFGTTQWIKTFPKTNLFVKCFDGNSVFQTSDGGYIIGTTKYTATSSSLVYTTAIYLIKTDNLGNVQWSKTYPGIGSSVCYCIKQTSDLGYVVCGGTTDTVQNLNYTYLMKTDNSGNPQWGKAYSDASNVESDNAYCVNQTSDGGYIVTGVSYTGTFVMKTDNTGTILWNHNMGTSGSDVLFCVKQTYDGGYIACGYGFQFPYFGATLLKFDGAGNSQWKKLYHDSISTSTQDESFSVEELSDGYMVLGSTSFDLCGLFKTDVSGNVQWANTYPIGFSYRPSALDHTSDGGYAFNSLWAGPTTVFQDVAVIKTDSMGLIGCHDSLITLVDTVYSPQTNLGFNTMSMCPSANTTTVFANVAIAFDTLCAGANQEGILDFSLANSITIFPNPTSGNFSVQMHSLSGNKIEIEIFDVLGQTVMEKKEENVSGNFEERLDLTAMSDGIYFVAVKVDGDMLVTKKVVKGN